MSYTVTAVQKGKDSTPTMSVSAPADVFNSATKPTINAVKAPQSPSEPTDKQQAPAEQQPLEAALESKPEGVKEVTLNTPDPRMAELERKERLLAEERRALQAEKAELQQARAQKPGLTAEEWKAKFLEDPSSVGMTYQEMADRYLSQPSEQDQVIGALKKEIADLRAQVTQGTSVLEQAQKTAYENAIKQLQADSKRIAAQSPQDYELIASHNAYDKVTDLISSKYKSEGYLMPVSEAMQQVENELFEQAMKYANLQKVRAKIAPAAPVEQPMQTQPQQVTSKSTTLSHSMTPASRVPSKNELIANAIAAFERNKRSA